MFCKLALRNVRRSVRDYTLYFLTLMFGVCVFYVFNSLENQWVMEALAANGRNVNYTGLILQLVDVISVFVAVVLACLILYANHFMLRRRKKELGMYLLLGMTQRNVSLILFLETLCIGLLALAAGLLMGFLAAQLLSAFTASLFQVVVEEFSFVFSWKGVGKTVLYFAIMFLLVMLFNAVTVSRKKLIDLLRAQRENQQLRLRSVTASAVMLIVGVVLLAVAYAMLLRRGLLRVDELFWVMLAMGTVGTLLFFRSLSGFLLKLCKGNRRFYYRGLNCFVLRQFNASINTNYLSMTVVCLLLLLAIGVTACSVGVNLTVEGKADRQAPVDMTLFVEMDDFTAEDMAQCMKDAGFDLDTCLEEYAIVQRPVLRIEGETKEKWGTMFLYTISLSDFNELLALQGEAPMTLAPERYGLAVGTEPEEYMDQQKDGWKEGKTLEVGGQVLRADPEFCHTGALYTTSSSISTVFVLPDDVMESIQPEEISIMDLFLAGNYPKGAEDETEDRLWDSYFVFQDKLTEKGSGYSISFSTKQTEYMEVMGTKLLVLFLGLYLGIIFLVTSAAVLALQQLSQAADNLQRYQVLSRLGVEENMRDRSVYTQIFLAFFLPLSLAIVHSIVGIKAANEVIQQLGKLDAVSSTVTTAVIILLVYGAYFGATCAGARRMVRGK